MTVSAEEVLSCQAMTENEAPTVEEEARLGGGGRGCAGGRRRGEDHTHVAACK